MHVPAILVNATLVSFLQPDSDGQIKRFVQSGRNIEMILCLASHIYTDPGEFETGVIGKITAPGLVCTDGENECTSAGNNYCQVSLASLLQSTACSISYRR